MDPIYYPILVLPAFFNIWSIWHAYTHEFPTPIQKVIWMVAGVFLPVIGGVAYLLFGMRNAQKK
ncbi:MAG: PLD nuclease N-terminal domain-containing protein [Pseudomonadota bacterium]